MAGFVFRIERRVASGSVTVFFVTAPNFRAAFNRAAQDFSENDLDITITRLGEDLT